MIPIRITFDERISPHNENPMLMIRTRTMRADTIMRRQTTSKKTGYIAPPSRTQFRRMFIKRWKIVFSSIEEERLSPVKYDGGPTSMVKILEYTDKIDYPVIAHTQSLKDRSTGRVDYNGDDVYTGLARKLGLIDKRGTLKSNIPQLICPHNRNYTLH